MSTTVAGIRFSDTLAALLDHAQANGFRVEKDTRGRNAKGVLLFAPDPDVPPLTVEERGAKFNRAHYENLRRELYRAGLPPLPADAKDSLTGGVVFAESRDEALAQMPEGSTATDLGTGFGLAETPELRELLDDPDTSPRLVAHVLDGILDRVGLGQSERDLISALAQLSTDWALRNSPDRIGRLADRCRDELAAEFEDQINTSLKMAEEAEARAVRAEKAAAKAEAKGAETGRMLTEAIARADRAETEAHRLEQALAPLRAILGTAAVAPTAATGA